MRRIALLLVLAIPAAAFAQDPQEKPTLVFDTGGHTGAIHKVLFTPDGKQLITVSEDKTIRIWDVESGQTVKVLHPPIGPGGEGGLLAAALSPNGKLLAVGGYGLASGDKHFAPIYVIHLAEGRVQQVLRGAHEGACYSLAFAPDNEHLASAAGKDGQILLWRLGKDKPEFVFQWKKTKNHVRALSFSPDGKFLTGCTVNMLGIFNLANKKITECYAGKSAKTETTSLAWSPDGKVVAAASDDGVIRLWNSDGILQKEFKQFPVADSVAFGPRSDRLLCAWGETATTSVVNLMSAKDEVVFKVRKGLEAKESVSSPDGTLVATVESGPEHLVYLWKAADGKVVQRLAGWGGWPAVRKASWSADGTTVDWGKRAFNLADLQFVRGKGKTGSNLVLKQGELSLVHVSKSDVIKVMKGDAIIATLRGPHDTNLFATFLGKDRAVVGTKQGNLLLFNAATGALLRRCQAHQRFLHSMEPSPDSRFVLSSGYDDIMVIWNPEQDRPLLYLLFGDDAKGKNVWIAWTPEGYYAASPDGERLIGWHASNGPDTLATYYPAAKFRQSLYRPDLIGRLIKEGTLEKALEAADKARGQKTEKHDVGEVLPPRARLISPVAGLRTANGELEVKAVAESVGTHPVTALQVLLDGRPYQGEQGVVTFPQPKPGKVEAAWKVQLPPGAHKLSVLARCAVSSATSDEIEVAYEPATTLDPRSQLPGLYVLAIGINAYPGDWKLHCAANDAVDIERIFKDKATPVFREVKTKLLTDKDATRQGVLDGFAWLKKEMKPQDIAVIFYAGHGERDAKGRFFLLPCDVNFGAVDKTGVSGEDIKKRLAELPGRVLMLLDACHSGAIGGKGGLTDELTRELSDDDCGVVVMCAAMGREEAGEERKLRHGYFALAVIEGLSGKADVSKRDGRVYLHHLEQYVIDRVQELSNDEQHPVVGKPTTVRSFALAKP